MYSATGPLFNSSKCFLGFQRAGTLYPSSWYYTKNMLHFQKEKKNRLLGMCKQVSYCEMCISRERKVVYLPYLSWYVFAGMCCLWACSQRGIWSRDVLCPVQPQVCWASRWNKARWNCVGLQCALKVNTATVPSKSPSCSQKMWLKQHCVNRI